MIVHNMTLPSALKILMLVKQLSRGSFSDGRPYLLKKKRLRVTISINILEDSNTPPSQSSKRGASSIIKRMLGEWEAWIDAEHFPGQPSAWWDVYNIMPNLVTIMDNSVG